VTARIAILLAATGLTAITLLLWKRPPASAGMPPAVPETQAARAAGSGSHGTVRLVDAPEFRPGASSRYDFLPEAKKAQVIGIDRDYTELTRLIHREVRNELQPVDIARLRLLEQEKEKDLAAVLSASEKHEYDLRFSSTAERLVYHLTAIDTTVAEYRTVFPLQREFEMTWRPGEPEANPSSEHTQARANATRALMDELVSRLGSERAKLIAWSQDTEFLLLTAAARRLGLPTQTPALVSEIRDATAAEGRQIVENRAWSKEEKRAALTRLAGQARDELRARLGGETLDAIGGELRWLLSLERGIVTTHDPLNRSVTIRLVGEVAPTPSEHDPYRPQVVPMGRVHTPDSFAPPEPASPEK
jgi:hypothetical protein